ncbi:uncharacterized protein MONOS_11963 [Monocercomonoides exilis]|uniref:uncharacterized protein n=1 Tax=Monocercomonoides exilis TaxID=2049356 RepID=UPI00355A9FC6|nr:hypothetical protein MONOS_11963 [Monocercomonoides exilis]|eukprot:MONOS_11963.1-p1 / transcript=MONOS_11963.1 / gene=MONOS_11963 / organism=Monocercomonoides_exilis_PA203 / gene_product=unspecified product / transcript_product=unspecified product / location=Mono_scaffold00631:14820-16547(-) / protein_length=575 / sequence_SO=supercontig / SO=protein_coding / is_pseudo=false
MRKKQISMIITIVSIVVGVGMTIAVLVWIYKYWKGQREARKLKRNPRDIELGEYERMDVDESTENKHSIHDGTGLVDEDTSIFDKPIIDKKSSSASNSTSFVKEPSTSSSLHKITQNADSSSRQSRPQIKIQPALPWIPSSKKASSSSDGKNIPETSASPDRAASSDLKEKAEDKDKKKKGAAKQKVEFEDPGTILPYPSTYVPGFPSQRPWIHYAVNPEFSLHKLIHSPEMKETDSSVIDLHAIVHRSHSPSGSTSSSSSSTSSGYHHNVPYQLRRTRPAIIPTLSAIARSLASLHRQPGKHVVTGALSTHTVLYDDAGLLYLNVRRSGHLVGEWDSAGKEENKRWAAPEIVGLKCKVKRGKEKEKLSEEEIAALKEEKKKLEAEEAKVVTPAADIFAFGSVVWEMLTLQIPYGNMNLASAVEAIAKNQPLNTDVAKTGARLQGFNDDVSRLLAELIAKCRVPDPAQRPNAEWIMNYLAKIDRHISPFGKRMRRMVEKKQKQRQALGLPVIETKSDPKQEGKGHSKGRRVLKKKDEKEGEEDKNEKNEKEEKSEKVEDKHDENNNEREEDEKKE